MDGPQFCVTISNFNFQFLIFRFHIVEQEEIFALFLDKLGKIIWYTKMGPGPGKNTKKSYKGFGPKLATSQLHWPYSFKLTMSTIQQLHGDLKINFDLKFLPTSKLDQNPLESDFNCIRGMGGMYSIILHTYYLLIM